MPVYTTTSEYSHLDRLHLEALYTAKSRQLKDVETEVKRIISENERKVRRTVITLSSTLIVPCMANIYMYMCIIAYFVT